MKQIPNFITSLNLAAGFIAVISAANGYLVAASWLIVSAMIFDFLDGFSARLLGYYSELGKELDSLADVVSFGVAPAMIMHKLLTISVQDSYAFVDGFGSILVSAVIYLPVLMPVCAALRLAKFNLDKTQTTSFKGLPTPANAIAVISVIIAAEYSSLPLPEFFTGSWEALSIYSVLLSFLMVTNIHLFSLKIKNLRFSGNEGRYILLGLIIISLPFLGFASALLIIPFYIIASLIERIF
jgi:CDP-diacylglycerol--serine O-phosphatidyltransferase